MNMLQAALKEQGTFRERKAARVASGPKLCMFEVENYGFDFPGEVVGSFESRAAAEKFANAQLGPDVGYTAAYRTLSARHPKAFLANSQRWLIKRVERV